MPKNPPGKDVLKKVLLGDHGMVVNIHLVRPFLSRGLVDFIVALAPTKG